ncbi:MAG: hypothetical protein HY791_21605 [Deltaproteobacteria bacterium]|nr:hypothetical protein [Deltaproteobacteria bacterium]
MSSSLDDPSPFHRGLVGRWSVILVLVLSFAMWAFPVFSHRGDKDPLTNHYTDHHRYRYCSALVLRRPVEALTRPLQEIYDSDPSPHRFVSWGAHPCTQAGILHLFVHAPFQWAMERGLIDGQTYTIAYVLLGLLLAHLAILWMLRSDRHWHLSFFLYPWLMRVAMIAVQSPLAFLIGYGSLRALDEKRYLRAALLYGVVLLEYNRWIALAPAVFYGTVILARQDTLEELRSYVAGWPGRATVAVVGLGVALTFAAMILVKLYWVDPADEFAQPQIAYLRYGLVAIWGAHFALRRTPFGLAGLGYGLFMVTYRGPLLLWYIEPFLAIVALARTRFQQLLWAGTALVISGIAIHAKSLLELRSLFDWVVASWLGLPSTGG